MKPGDYSLGVDLGGTKIAIGLVDHSGKMIRLERIPTSKKGPQVIVDDIISTVKKVDNGDGKIVAAGVGMAGQISLESGIVHFAPNLGWGDFPLGDALTIGLKVPVRVLNDVRAITWGEWLYGAGQGYNDFLCVFIGTGIGGGIISGGKILTGSDNAAGEVGHITIDLKGSLCTCGNRGCFETLSAGWAIARRAQEMLVSDPAGGHGLLALVGGKADEITAKHVFEACRSKVPVALKVVDEAKEGLIAGIASLVNTFNPRRIILGGGVIQGNPELIGVVRQGIVQRALKVATESLEIVPAALKENAGVIGAAAFATYALFRK
ncbi:MAG: ROK family protein [Parachlamydiaceae bacterium]